MAMNDKGQYSLDRQLVKTYNAYMRFAITKMITLSLLCLIPAQAATKHKKDADYSESTSSGLSRLESIKLAQKHIQGWPPLLQEAFFAEQMELLFMEDGSLPYENNGEKRSWPGETAPTKEVRKKAQFVGTDGKLHDWWDEGHREVEYHSQYRSEWRDVKNTIAKYNERAVLSPFSKEIDKLKKLHAEKTKSPEEIRREEARHERALKNADKDAENILKSMGKMKTEARMAILACLEEGVSLQNALSHSYANSDGTLCFVYETLQGEDNVNEALEILDKAGQVEVIGTKVLSKFGKRIKALQKGEKFRALHLEAAEKQYEAYQALSDTQTTEVADNEGELLEEVRGRVDKTQDRLCRMVLLRIISEEMSVKELFSKIVLDSWHAPHSCFDVLVETNQLDQALQLMANLDASDNLRKELASLYASEYKSEKRELEKRRSRIVLALKQYEAKQAKENLKELQNSHD